LQERLFLGHAESIRGGFGKDVGDDVVEKALVFGGASKMEDHDMFGSRAEHGVLEKFLFMEPQPLALSGGDNGEFVGGRTLGFRYSMTDRKHENIHQCRHEDRAHESKMLKQGNVGSHTQSLF
jgi:hypothetical protein